MNVVRQCHGYQCWMRSGPQLGMGRCSFVLYISNLLGIHYLLVSRKVLTRQALLRYEYIPDHAWVSYTDAS